MLTVVSIGSGCGPFACNLGELLLGFVAIIVKDTNKDVPLNFIL